jgi:hypothetical protein
LPLFRQINELPSKPKSLNENLSPKRVLPVSTLPVTPQSLIAALVKTSRVLPTMLCVALNPSGTFRTSVLVFKHSSEPVVLLVRRFNKTWHNAQSNALKHQKNVQQLKHLLLKPLCKVVCKIFSAALLQGLGLLSRHHRW